MKYLLDTNIWLEGMLGQQRAEEVGQLLHNVPLRLLGISHLALHSICIILMQRNRKQELKIFLNDLVLYQNLSILTLPDEYLPEVVQTATEYNLDFEDSYQYMVCQEYNLQLVSYDKDFDISKITRLTPLQVLEQISR